MGANARIRVSIGQLLPAEVLPTDQDSGPYKL